VDLAEVADTLYGLLPEEFTRRATTGPRTPPTPTTAGVVMLVGHHADRCVQLRAGYARFS